MSKEPTNGNKGKAKARETEAENRPATPRDSRRERLESALRANLARRKEQARARREKLSSITRTSGIGAT